MAQRKARNANSLYYPPGFATLSQANVLPTHSILIRMLKKVVPFICGFVWFIWSIWLSGSTKQTRHTEKTRETSAFPAA